MKRLVLLLTFVLLAGPVSAQTTWFLPSTGTADISPAVGSATQVSPFVTFTQTIALASGGVVPNCKNLPILGVGGPCN